MPSFVVCFFLVLGVDFCLLFTLLSVTDEATFMLLVLMLILLVPMLGFTGGPMALDWQRQRLTQDSRRAPLGTSLAPLTCVSSLVFLVCCCLLTLAPREDHQWNDFMLFFFLYILVQKMRLQYGMWVNLLVATVVLIKPDRPGDRVFALGSALGAGAGLGWMATSLPLPGMLACTRVGPLNDSPSLEYWLGMAVFVAMGFCYGLMWGGTGLWLLGRRSQAAPDQSQS